MNKKNLPVKSLDHLRKASEPVSLMEILEQVLFVGKTGETQDEVRIEVML
jgi:hypothetical protein